MTILATRLATLVGARLNCLNGDHLKQDWADRHEDRILRLVKDNLPSGAGFDNGTHIDLEKSTPERLVFTTAFHHMDDHGGYIGWSDHTVTVTPSLQFLFNLKVGGRDRRGIKEYIAEEFHAALNNSDYTEIEI